MTYGEFDSNAREFVIHRPDTPTPWINYIGDQHYGGIISNTAGGYSFDGDPRYRRLLRYRYNNVPADRPGRYLYIVDEDGSFWSPTWAPTGTPLDRYECRHGLGYTRITGGRQQIHASGTFFVPPGARLEVWRWHITNRGPKPAKIRTFSYAEFCPYDADNDLSNLDWTQQIAQCWAEGQTIFYTTHMRTTGCTFLHASLNPAGFDCDRDAFLGRYGSEAAPFVVQQGKAGGSRAYRGNGAGCFAHELLLAPGQCIELVFLLGIAPDENAVGACLSPYSTSASLDGAFEELRSSWRERLSAFSVGTADGDLNEMVNTWNPYQCFITFNWARFASLYECGIRRGIGFRDSCQDTLGIVHSDPVSVRQRMVRLLANQFAKGDAYHQYFPFTGEGDRVGYSDDHLWAVLANTQYLRETGDTALLDELVPFADGGGGTVYDHLNRAVAFSLAGTGPHGVPRLGFADWNDALNLSAGPAPAESVLVGFLLARALLELAELADFTDHSADALRFRSDYRCLSDLLNSVAWDGEWYLRAWNGDGSTVGSRFSPEGRIFLNTQSWAVISGVAPRERAGTCMDSALRHLNTPLGLMLMTPPYSKYDTIIGGCTTYPPGAKENGGIFLQTNPWAIIAETMLGRGDGAHQLYRQIAPPTHLDDAERFQAEPYVFCQNILGTSHPEYGLGRNSWLTGTAAWAYVAVTQYILGIRPHYDRLIVAPCIPAAWPGFRVQRRFRGATYDIDVQNPGGVSSGVGQLLLDGRPVPFVPALSDGRVHQVVAVLGGL